MKNKKFLTLSIVSAACILASCSSSDFNIEENNKILFYSQITNVQSRLNGNLWNDNDEIGIYMQTDAKTEVNKKYLAKTDGNLVAAPGNELFFPLKGTANFLAYYPYNPTLQNMEVPISVADQSKPAAIDFLYSCNATQVNPGEVVSLQFTHKLSKFTVNIKTDETIKDTKGMAVRLTGMNTTATFQLNDGILSPADSKADINMKVNETGTMAEAIILPSATLDNMVMHFSLNGTTSQWPITIQDGQSIEAGCKYVFNATLSIKQNQQQVTMGNTIITDWTEKPGGDINVELEEDTEINPTDPETKPEPEPEPQPEYTESIVLMDETFGDPGSSKSPVNSYRGWTDKHRLSYSNPLVAEGKDNAVIRQTSLLNGHLWFTYNKNSAFRITGIDAKAYKAVKLTYDIAANYMQAAAPDQNVIIVSTDKGEITVPSKTLIETDKYQSITVSLPVDFTYLQFTSKGTTNLDGYRLDNVKVVGLR